MSTYSRFSGTPPYGDRETFPTIIYTRINETFGLAFYCKILQPTDCTLPLIPVLSLIKFEELEK